MDPLTITYRGGTYELVIANEGSVELADVDGVVQLLANAMTSGLETVVAESGSIFANGALSTEEVTAIFTDVDALFLEADLVFDAAAVGAASILEVLADAGAALLAVL